MTEMWRVIDTGLRAAAQNIALDRALLEARHAEEIPSTLRFSRFAPSVLIASRHSAAHEANPAYCSASDIAMQRRLTGGDAFYCDAAQLGWALYLHQRDVKTFAMQAVARRIGHALASALIAAGVPARHRPPHDIEVDSRRLGTAGGVFEGDALLYQGVLYLDLSLPTLLLALRTPAYGPVESTVAAARERFTDVRTVLGERPDVVLIKDRMIAAFESEFAAEIQEADLSLSEHARYQHALAEIDTADWLQLVRQPSTDVQLITGEQQFAAGMLRADILYDRGRQRIKQVWFTRGSNSPETTVTAGLEAALSDTGVDRLERNVRAYLAGREGQVFAWAAAEFISVLRRALQLPLVAGNYPAKPSS